MSLINTFRAKFALVVENKNLKKTLYEQPIYAPKFINRRVANFPPGQLLTPSWNVVVEP